MKIEVRLNLSGLEKVLAVTGEAARFALRDVVVEVAAAAAKGSPALTGNNRRSLFFGVSGMGAHRQASEGEGRGEHDRWTGPDPTLLDESRIEGTVYSTSGYGGYLETGTASMAARPYMKPALDQYFTRDNLANKVKGYLK
jgi:hypothetical protein